MASVEKEEVEEREGAAVAEKLKKKKRRKLAQMVSVEDREEDDGVEKDPDGAAVAEKVKKKKKGKLAQVVSVEDGNVENREHDVVEKDPDDGAVAEKLKRKKKGKLAQVASVEDGNVENREHDGVEKDPDDAAVPEKLKKKKKNGKLDQMVSVEEEDVEKREDDDGVEKDPDDAGVADKLKKKNKRKKELHFRFGNYHNYYGYRHGTTVDEDPRLNFFKREWFEGKRCLDVGCNTGIITTAIAQKYQCRSILGLDIDEVLIEKAMKNLSSDFEELQGLQQEWWKNTLAWRNLNARDAVGDKMEFSGITGKRGRKKCTKDRSSWVQRVVFRQENFISDFPEGDYCKDGTFDTVLCNKLFCWHLLSMSLTKWIHLNWGDEGLIRLFGKIFHVLRPGGVLILEPQPWKSYKRKARFSETTREYFNSIQLRPEHFPEVLLDKIGFKSYRELSTAVPGSTVGFDRSLFLYFK